MPFWADGQPIEGTRRADGTPVRFRCRMTEHVVTHVSVRWRVHTAWWTEHEIWRDYWEVVTSTRLLVVIYEDRIRGGWWLERVYE